MLEVASQETAEPPEELPPFHQIDDDVGTRVKHQCCDDSLGMSTRSRVAHSPETRRSLLIRLRDQADTRAWCEFVDLYAPLIHAYAMRRGLQDADAADLAQQVLESVARAVGDFDYDPSKGTFRGWLFAITRNCLFQRLRKRDPVPSGTGDTGAHQALNQQPDDADDQEFWDREHQRRLFDWAAKQAREEFRGNSWRAFWATAMEGRSAAEAADELGISLGAVYTAKSRVTARIRQIVQAIEDE